MKSVSINAHLEAIDIHLFEFGLYFYRFSFWVHKSEHQSTLSGCSLMKTVTGLDAKSHFNGTNFSKACLFKEVESFVELEICDSSKSTWSWLFERPADEKRTTQKKACRFMGIEVGCPFLSSIVGDMISFRNWEENSDSNISWCEVLIKQIEAVFFTCHICRVSFIRRNCIVWNCKEITMWTCVLERQLQ